MAAEQDQRLPPASSAGSAVESRPTCRLLTSLLDDETVVVRGGDMSRRLSLAAYLSEHARPHDLRPFEGSLPGKGSAPTVQLNPVG